MRLFLPLLLALAAFCSRAVQAEPGDPTKIPVFVQCKGKNAFMLTFYKRFERVCVRWPQSANMEYLQFVLASLAGETRPIQVRNRALWRRVLRRQAVSPDTPLDSLAGKQLEASVLDGNARLPLDTRFTYVLPRLDMQNVPLLSVEAVSMRYHATFVGDVLVGADSPTVFFPELTGRHFRAIITPTPEMLSRLFPNRTYTPVQLRTQESRLIQYMPAKVYSFPMKRSTYFCGAKIPYRISDLGMRQMTEAFASEYRDHRSKHHMIVARRPRTPEETHDPTIVLLRFVRDGEGDFVTLKETVLDVEPVPAPVKGPNDRQRYGRRFFRNFFSDNRRMLSRLGGALSRLRMSRCFLWKYAQWTNADLEEAFSAKPTYPESARNFTSLQDFFTRKINVEVLRPIDRNALVVSPADSVVQNAFHILPNENGEIHDAHIPQVKGTTFNLSEFLFGRGTNRSIKLQSPDNALHVQIFYLSPADYHRFHSSADWKATRHVYIPGCIPSVRRNVLLNRNFLDSFERTSVQGHWRPGNTVGPRLFFSMTFVAAMMVGGIELLYRKHLDSNNFSFTPSCASMRRSIVYEYDQPVPLCMGQEMGSFKFGSTVVLVFEAPKDFTASAPVCEHVDVSSTVGRIVGSPRRTLPRCDFTYGNHSNVVDYLKHIQTLQMQDAAEDLNGGPSVSVPIAPHLQASAGVSTETGGVVSMLEQESGEATEGGAAGTDDLSPEGAADDAPFFDAQPPPAMEDELGPPQQPEDNAEFEPPQQPLDEREPEMPQPQFEDTEPQLPAPRGTEEGEAPLWWFEGQQPSRHRSVVKHVTGEEKPFSHLTNVSAKVQMVESGLIRRYALARFLSSFWTQQTAVGSSGGSVLLQLGGLEPKETDSNVFKLPTCYFEESTRTVLLRFSGKKSTLLLMLPAARNAGFFLRYPNFACASSRGWGKKTRGVRASWSVSDEVLNVSFRLSVTQRVDDQTASVGEQLISFAAAGSPTPKYTPPSVSANFDESMQQSWTRLGVSIRVRHFRLSGPQDISEGGEQQLFTVSSGSETFVIPQPSSARHELTCPDSPFYRIASAISRGIRRLPFFRRGQEEPEGEQ